LPSKKKEKGGRECYLQVRNARRQSQTISGVAALSPSAVQRPERNHNQSITLRHRSSCLGRKSVANPCHRQHSHRTTNSPLPIQISNNTSPLTHQIIKCNTVPMYPLQRPNTVHPRHATWGALSAGRVRLSLVSRTAGKGFPSKRSACVGIMPVNMRRSTRGRKVQTEPWK
jgi:hypothetical protein